MESIDWPIHAAWTRRLNALVGEIAIPSTGESLLESAPTPKPYAEGGTGVSPVLHGQDARGARTEKLSNASYSLWIGRRIRSK